MYNQNRTFQPRMGMKYAPRQNAYGNSYQNTFNSNRSNQPEKKYSGAKTGYTKDGKLWISGWKKDKFQPLASFMIMPVRQHKGKAVDEVYTSKSGKEYIRGLCVIKQGFQETKFSCLINLQSKQVKLTDLNLVIDPNKGYIWRPKKK